MFSIKSSNTIALIPRYKVANLTDAVVYCKGTDEYTEYPIRGEKHSWTLREIAKKAINILEIDTKDRNNEQVYEEFCKKLDSKVEGGQPYCNKVSISDKSSVNSVMSSVKNMIPIENESLEFKCEETVKRALNGVDLSVAELGSLLYTSDKNFIKIDEFIVMQVLKTGYCIDIIPTYIKFYGVAEGQRVLFFSKSEVSVSVNYRQTRYTLNRGHIMSIIKKLDDDEKSCSF